MLKLTGQDMTLQHLVHIELESPLDIKDACINLEPENAFPLRLSHVDFTASLQYESRSTSK